MTAPWWLVRAQTIAGTVTRHTAMALLTAADWIDPPPLSPRIRALETLTAGERCHDYVPVAWIKEQL